MKLVVLSTETPHHTYFINRIHAVFPLTAVIYETSSVQFSYDTQSNFSDLENQFERREFFKTVPSEICGSIPVFCFSSVNSLEAQRLLSELGADLALVFGTGKIAPETMTFFKSGMLNIHRGKIRDFRGLDSDLWAIYHGFFDSIGTTIHFIDQSLDTGDVVAEGMLSIAPEDEVWHLRYLTTVLSTDLMLGVLRDFQSQSLKRLPQLERGRYYSAMPSVLKAFCRKKFEGYKKRRLGSIK